MEPIDQKLYKRVQAAAKRKFDVFPSVYANAWVVEEYKRRGGKFKGKKPKDGLKKWFKERWVDLSRPKEGGGYETCGRPDAEKGYPPKCVPEKIAKKMTKKEIKSAIQRKRYNETAKGTEGKGRKPVNVRTFKED